MKRKLFFWEIICVCILLISLISCATKDKSPNDKGSDSLRLNDINKNQQTKTVGFENETPLLTVFYQIPSPDEVLVIFNSEKTFKQRLLLPTENLKNLVDAPNQALNLGSYSADLAYCVTSKQYQTSLTYFTLVRKLAERLGISSVFDKNMAGRIENNINNIDSLQQISNETYFRIIDHLIEIDNGKTLIYITVGGYVESIFIMSNAIDVYLKNSPQIIQLANLKKGINNILKCAEFFADDKQFTSIITNLQDLKIIYDQLSVREKQKNTTSVIKDNKVIVDGGQEYTITEKQFNQLKEMIRNIRKQIIEIGVK